MGVKLIMFDFEEFITRTRWDYHFTINEERVRIPVAEVFDVDRSSRKVQMSLTAAEKAGLL